MSVIGPLLLLSALTISIRASTHWMVTENGLIQPRLDSPFEMANPYDVLAFLNQDTRWESIINTYHDLSKRKDSLRKLWTELGRETDIDSNLLSDENCVKAGPLDTFDWYASLLEDGRARKIVEEDFKLYNLYYGQETDVPDCKKISSLTFSMFAFEHLEAMAQRENVTANPELALPEQVSPMMNIEQFGHWAANNLRHNSSSWLHYHMASLYWRVRGNAPKALECSRRAVYYAPREYKDLALLSLGTIFHRGKKTEDALIVLNAAVDHNPHYSGNHFVLANAYAVYGDFNSSMKHLNACLKTNPAFDLAQKHKYGVLCHSSLMSNMKNIHSILDQLRSDLVEYRQIETNWLKSQATFLRIMRHSEDFDFRNVEKTCEKMSELTGLNIKELKKEGDKNSLIQYFLDGPMYNDEWHTERGIHAIESVLSLQRLVKHVEKHAHMVSEVVAMPDQLVLSDGVIRKEIGPMPDFLDDPRPTPLGKDPIRGRIVIDGRDYMTEPKVNVKAKSGALVENDHFEFEGGIVLYPPTMKISRNLEDFDKDDDWPSTKFCRELSPRWPKNLDLIYPVFLPFENKGIRLKTLLSDMIGVPEDREHELPWHPPVCTTDKDTTFTLKKNQKPQVAIEVAPSLYLKYKLMEYIGNGNSDAVKHMQDAEIGQRIYAAMEMELAPKWLLHTLASLYWRVRGNSVNAINCLLTASKTVPPRHRDVVLTSLASVYLEIGSFDDAMLTAEEAFRLSLYEPSTNFIIAQLNMVKRHRNTQLFHLKQVVRVEPRFMGGVVRDILDGWACQLQKQFAQEMVEISENDICTQVEPGISMVCEKDGTNCHMTNVECFHARSTEGSTLIHYLELKGHNIHHVTSITEDRLDDSVFDEFLDNMPTKRSDVIGHQQNLDRMKSKLDSVLRGCGDRGCKNIEAEDLSLSQNDCSYQHLQLSYWLSYKQLLTDATVRIPLEILLMQPSPNTVPECALPEETYDDFILERISKVDTEGWEPAVELMQHFAHTFDFYDYVNLGAKISRYVENRPKDWVAAMTAAWWCGASGNGHCAARCALAAAANTQRGEPLLALLALLQVQSKLQDAKDIAYLMFYLAPKSKLGAFLVAVTHTSLSEYEQAVWMYRYVLTLDERFLPAKACFHATMCLMLFGDKSKLKPEVD